jgi:O-antigen ligase
MKQNDSLKSPETKIERLLRWVVLLPAFLLPLIISPTGADPFRLPKELALRGHAIVIGGVLLILIALKPGFYRHTIDRTTAILISAIAIAIILPTLTSTNPAISIRSVAYATSCLVLFAGAYAIAHRMSLFTTVAVVAGAAIPNALVALAQRFGANPFHFDESLPQNMRISALIGNPNDLGSYLALCLVVLFAYAVVARKAIAIGAAIVVACGIFITESMTAIVASTISVIVLTLIHWGRRWRASMAILLIAGITVVIVTRQWSVRADSIMHAVRTGNLQALSSNRLISFIAAWNLFQDYPLTGAGPGTFRWHYLRYRTNVEERNPQFYLANTQNFGEVHNDHLQILAEEGLLGYATFGAAMTVFVYRGMRRGTRDLDLRRPYAALISLPLAVALVILAVGSFPLELSAVITRFILIGACVMRWSSETAHA